MPHRFLAEEQGHVAQRLRLDRHPRPAVLALERERLQVVETNNQCPLVDIRS